MRNNLSLRLCEINFYKGAQITTSKGIFLVIFGVSALHSETIDWMSAENSTYNHYDLNFKVGGIKFDFFL